MSASATQNVVPNAWARAGRARAGSAAAIAAAPPMLPWKPGRCAAMACCKVIASSAVPSEPAIRWMVPIVAVAAPMVRRRRTMRRTNGSADGAPVFAGIAPAGAAARYLSGVAYATVTGSTGGHPSDLGHAGGSPAILPAQAPIWTVKTTGPGTQTLSWPVTGGRWTVVAMNANGSAPVNVRVNVAASLPALPWIATGLLIAGAVLLAAGALLITLPVRDASRERAAPASG